MAWEVVAISILPIVLAVRHMTSFFRAHRVNVYTDMAQGKPHLCQRFSECAKPGIAQNSR